MKARAMGVGLAWLLAGCTAGLPAGPGVPAARGAPVVAAAVARVVADEQARQGVPGLAVGVVRHGRVMHAAGHGLANLEHAVPVTRQTVFQSGSLAKQFAAVATMLLVEDGRLSLDDPVARWFPEAPPSWSPITVRHLLTHTSGIPNFADGALDLRRDYGEAQWLQQVWRLSLAFAPGERWLYSDTGYALLGLLIGRASGRFYGELLRERVFEPLGMAGARVISEADIVMHRAAGYRRDGLALKNQDWVAPSWNTTADGAMYLSLDDWLGWEQAMRQRSVLSASSWAQILSPVRLAGGQTHPYGLGWELPQAPARVQHLGAWQGFQAAYVHWTEAGLTVIVLANLAQADPMRLAERIGRALAPSLASQAGKL